jgi:hypothetical protein
MTSKAHMQTFLMAYNFVRQLKTLKGLTPLSTSAKYGLKTQTSLLSTRATTLWG